MIPYDKLSFWILGAYFLNIAIAIVALAALGWRAFGSGKAKDFTDLLITGWVLHLMTTAIIVGGILILAAEKVLTESTTGALLGAVAGYVLSELRGRSAKKLPPSTPKTHKSVIDQTE
jgi:hypothetical protein